MSTFSLWGHLKEKPLPKEPTPLHLVKTTIQGQGTLAVFLNPQQQAPCSRNWAAAVQF